MLRPEQRVIVRPGRAVQLSPRGVVRQVLGRAHVVVVSLEPVVAQVVVASVVVGVVEEEEVDVEEEEVVVVVVSH